MLKVTYRERRFIDRYSCIDTIKTFTALSVSKPAGTSLNYFRLDRFNLKTISDDDLIKIETI